MFSSFLLRRFTLLAALFTIIAFNSPYPLTAAEFKDLPQPEAVKLLTKLAESWERSLNREHYVSGRVMLIQESIVKQAQVIEGPLNPGEKQNKFKKEVNLRGRFKQIDVVDIDFKADFKNQHHWCRWHPTQPQTWIDMNNKNKIYHGRQLKDTVSILTDKAYFHQTVGSKSQGILDGGPSRAALLRMDVEQNREMKGGWRGIVYRDQPQRGRSHRERSDMFDSSKLLQPGGSYPFDFLKKVVKHLESGMKVRIRKTTDDAPHPAIIKIQIPYRGSTPSAPVLIVDSTWIESKKSTGPMMLLESMSMNFDDGNDRQKQIPVQTNSYYKTEWKWDHSRLKEGLAIPVSWDFIVGSNSTSTPSFHRHVEVIKWDLVDPFSEKAFKPEALELRLGDLIYDRNSKTVRYVKADKSSVLMKNKAN